MLVADHLGPVLVLTLNRPESRNAFNHHLYMALSAALTDAAVDTSVNAVVITGTDPAFSSGQDLKEMAAMASGELVFADGFGFVKLLDALENFPKPLLAAVNGAAAGIGLTMLLHCDIVLVSSSARLRVPFAELGVPPEAGSSALLAQRVGWQKAAELLFTSEWMGASDAVACGLALREVPHDRLMDETLAIAQRIASFDPRATSTAKKLMLAARGTTSQDARAREESEFAKLFGSRRGG
jgi:enoyl-CoA hydratase/carnithine racemase